MTYLNAAVALLAVLGLLASAIGWRHSLRTWAPAEPEWWFSVAKVFYAVAIGSRIIVWDVFWGPWAALDRAAAVSFSEAVGGTDINIVTSALVLAGAYCSLKARQLLIPEADRDRWPWWRAWAHPSWRLFR